MILTCVRTHNDDSGDMENRHENGKGCECYTCNETGVDHMVKRLYFKSH